MGFAFAFGWTPCIGPILAGVLAVAATAKPSGQGVFLLACYSAGLAIPFLVTALGIGGFLRFYQAISATSAHSGSIQRSAAACDRRFDILEPADVAFRQAGIS